MRVAHVDSASTWRGGQRQVLLLARGLLARGHDCLILTPPQGALAARAHASGIGVSPLRARVDLDIAAAARLRGAIRDYRPDIVHAHDARSHAIALLALIGLRIRLVVSRRVTFTPRGRVKYGSRVEHFIAVSEAVRASLLRGGVVPERITVVHSGIELTESANPRDWRAFLAWPPSAVVCGVVGAMTPEKGIHELELICSALPSAVAPVARLVLVGGEDRPRRHGIGGVDSFSTGFVDDVAAAVAGLDVLWHPSHSEGLGTALLDGMLHGVPVVAYGVGGIPEILDADSGILVEPGNPRAFAAAAGILLADSRLRERLSAGARSRARRFSAERMIAGTLTVYEKVLGRAAGSVD